MGASRRRDATRPEIDQKRTPISKNSEKPHTILTLFRCRGHRFRPNFGAEGAPGGALFGFPIRGPILDHFGGPGGPKTDPGGALGGAQEGPEGASKIDPENGPKMDTKTDPKWAPRGVPKKMKKEPPRFPAGPPLFSVFPRGLPGPQMGPRRAPVGPGGVSRGPRTPFWVPKRSKLGPREASTGPRSPFWVPKRLILEPISDHFKACPSPPRTRSGWHTCLGWTSLSHLRQSLDPHCIFDVLGNFVSQRAQALQASFWRGLASTRAGPGRRGTWPGGMRGAIE